MKITIRMLIAIGSAWLFVFLLAWFAFGFSAVQDWPLNARFVVAFIATMFSIFALMIEAGTR